MTFQVGYFYFFTTNLFEINSTGNILENNAIGFVFSFLFYTVKKIFIFYFFIVSKNKKERKTKIYSLGCYVDGGLSHLVSDRYWQSRQIRWIPKVTVMCSLVQDPFFFFFFSPQNNFILPFLSQFSYSHPKHTFHIWTVRYKILCRSTCYCQLIMTSQF